MSLVARPEPVRPAPVRPRGGLGVMGAGAAGAAAALAAQTVAQVVLPAVGAVRDLARHSLDLAGDAEQTRTALRLMVGEIGKADRALAGLRKYAAESPFNSREVIANARQLMAFGIAADDLVPTMRTLGDVAIGTGTEVQRIAYAYGQVRTAGRLMGTELKQFTEAGVPIIEYLAKTMGKPRDQIRDLVEQARVSVGDVDRAFIAMTGSAGRFYNLGAEGAKTFKGRLEQLTDAVERPR